MYLAQCWALQENSGEAEYIVWPEGLHRPPWGGKVNKYVSSAPQGNGVEIQNGNVWKLFPTNPHASSGCSPTWSPKEPNWKTGIDRWDDYSKSKKLKEGGHMEIDVDFRGKVKASRRRWIDLNIKHSPHTGVRTSDRFCCLILNAWCFHKDFSLGTSEEGRCYWLVLSLRYWFVLHIKAGPWWASHWSCRRVSGGQALTL